jgi:hypothetical protein
MEPVSVTHMPLVDAVAHFQAVLQNECCLCETDTKVVFDVMRTPLAGAAHETRNTLAKSHIMARDLLMRGSVRCSLGHETVTREVQYEWDAEKEWVTITFKQPMLAMCMALIRRLTKTVVEPESATTTALLSDLTSIPLRIAVLQRRGLKERTDAFIARLRQGEHTGRPEQNRGLFQELITALTRVAELSCTCTRREHS